MKVAYCLSQVHQQVKHFKLGFATEKFEFFAETLPFDKRLPSLQKHKTSVIKLTNETKSDDELKAVIPTVLCGLH